MTYHDEEDFVKLEQIKEKYDKLYAAVKYAHEQRGDDKCWMDFDKVFEAAGLPPQDKNVGDKFAMIKNCFRYVSCLTDGNWKTYEQLENENKELRDRITYLELPDTHKQE